MGWAVRALVRIVASIILGTALLWAVSMGAVLLWSEMDQARPAGSIVVLGAAQYDGKPSPVLKARLDHGIDLWNRRMGEVLVLTGGQGSGDTTSEAAVGRAYARKQGVPDSVILLENKGRTTRESMLAVADTLGKRGIKSAILVSDPFHMLRLWHQCGFPPSAASLVQEVGESVFVFTRMTGELDHDSLVFFHADLR